MMIVYVMMMAGFTLQCVVPAISCCMQHPWTALVSTAVPAVPLNARSVMGTGCMDAQGNSACVPWHQVDVVGACFKAYVSKQALMQIARVGELLDVLEWPLRAA